MKLTLARIAVIGCALLFAACGTDCSKACQHAHDVCTSGPGAFDLDTAECTSFCQDNLAGCKNLDDEANCLESATACTDLQKCPACLSD